MFKTSERKRRNARKAKQNKNELIRKAKSVPCADCGGVYPTCAMDFDHVRGLKSFNLGHGQDHSYEAISRELEKCEVVCANCHRIRTWSKK